MVLYVSRTLLPVGAWPEEELIGYIIGIKSSWSEHPCIYLYVYTCEVGFKVSIWRLVKLVAFGIYESCPSLTFTGSPSSTRKSGTSCPSSKNSSPNSSPRTLGRSKGRLRLPQIGSKNKLSSSKENLVASRENGAGQVCELADASSRGHMLGGSQTELITPQDHEGALANGFLYEHEACGNGYSNGQLENHSEEDSTDDQREDVHVKPIYNLYAISVSGYMVFRVICTLWFLHLHSFISHFFRASLFARH